MDCTFISPTNDHVFIGLDNPLNAALDIIEDYAPKVSSAISGEIRVPPLAITALQRGGKTTFLMFLFQLLKDNGYAPIAISFSGEFRLRSG